MGTWKLEVFRMAIYMAFPVALFHFFNQPKYFENWVTKTRQEIYPPDNSKDIVNLRIAIKEIQKAQELEALQELDSNM